MHDSTSSTLLTLPPKQPYRINNCKFQNSMISFLSELHATKAYTDVVLHAEGKLLHAHRVVLAAGSSYFNNLFKSLTPPPSPPTSCPNLDQHYSSSSNIVIALPNVKYKDLERVIKFVYLGYLDIVNSELDGFVSLAKELGVVGMSADEDDDDNNTQQELPHEVEVEVNTTTTTKLETESCVEEDKGTFNTSQEEEEDDTHDLYEAQETSSHPHNDSDYNNSSVNLQEGVIHSNDDPSSLLEASASSSPPPPTLPNEFLQVNYTDDEDDELGGYGLDDEMMDEDEENYGNNPGGGSSSSATGINSLLFGNNMHEKPFECQKCGKKYNSNKSLWRHKKFTCDEKIEFKCTVCGKVFSRSDNLRRHVVVAHS